ncbi:MAG: undecaprenyldiphospho-muramoylpentapeptide beta-N-acetylglucosaminyltransferase, partial [Tannerella sp.]|nr:undecaprenyldiphospho-muramoylpentapeptide beta-N-acetylglucosaminyltransferase [Tannerella sp.]
DAEILFIGADNRMEMERVPAAGYKIIGLPVSGFNRAHKLRNISVLTKLVKSLKMAKKIIRDFQPDVAIGVGGYASGPTLWQASRMKIPVVIQEQNSYAGVTNKLLGKRAARICVAYRGMERFFPKDRIVLTGNPVRKDMETVQNKSVEAFDYFGLEADKPVLLIVGGSLGARTVNTGIKKGLRPLLDAGIQVVWQTGKFYFASIQDELKELKTKGLWVSDFIARMDFAYSIADLVVSRAGAGTISELCVLGKPAILVPSPNVSEDHQTKNALALSENNAAALIPDNEAENTLAMQALGLMGDREKLQSLSENIALLAQYHSAERIVDEIIKVI